MFKESRIHQSFDYINALMNLSGQVHTIRDISTYGITLDGDNENYYCSKQDDNCWLFKNWMFEDPSEIKIQINENIPNIFGDMIYGTNV